MTFIVGFNPLLIFLASFINKKSVWKITKLDLICGGLSFAGLLLWLVTQVGNIAILFAILADLLAGIPTVIKAYREPETENYHAFFFGVINAAITLLVIKTWDFAHYAFPIYIFAICALLVLLIRFKLGKIISKKNL